MKTDLITEVESAPLKTVLVVGNGAVEGGNEPLRAAIRECEEYDRYAGIQGDYKLSSPDLATYLGALAFVARDNRYAILRLLSQNDRLGQEERVSIEAGSDFLSKMRSAIGRSFCDSLGNNAITLRQYEDVYRYLNLKDGESFGVVSINWDELLFKNKRFSKHLIALHGRASRPESIILPMESTIDEVMIDLFLKAHSVPPNSEEGLLITKAFRPNPVREEHDYVHSVAMRWFLNARRIIIWGVAFNVYDAELMSLIPKDERDRTIVIINPDPRARDIAGTLLAGNPKQRIDYDPTRKEQIIKV